MFIGTWVSGFVVDSYKVGEGHNWTSIWMVPAYIAAAVFLYFLLFFKEKKEPAEVKCELKVDETGKCVMKLGFGTSD